MDKIEWCRKCKKRKFDPQQGIVCGLTNEKPAFEGNCPEYDSDEKIKEHIGLDLRSNEQRAKVLLSFIWIVLALEVIALISSALQYDLLNIVAKGGGITNEAANANDLREQVVGIFFLIAYIISGVTFIMWFRRAYFNLHQRVKYLSSTEGWAAGSWFVPFVNLYRPYQIMKELYVETERYLNGRNETLQLDLNTKFLGWWWAFWIINGIFGQVIFRLSKNADTLEDLLTITILSIIGGLFGVGLGFVTIRVVSDYSKVEGLLISEEK